MNTTVAPPIEVFQAPSLNNTFGAILLGTFVGVLMYGLTLGQTYSYFLSYGKDVALLKALVFMLCALDTLHSVICAHMSYHYLVANYFNALELLLGVWSIRILTPITNAIIIIAQIFYIRRIYLLSGPSRVRLFIVPLAAILITGSFAFAIAATVGAFISVTFAEWMKYTWMTSAAFGFGVATDILLTTTLVIYLRSHRTGIRRTDSMLNTVVLYSINTGLLTSTLSFLCLMFAVIQPDNFIYVALNMPTTKSYVNSVLAVLNSRRRLAEIGAPGTNGFETFAFTGMDKHGEPGSSGLPANQRNVPSGGVVGVRISTAETGSASASDSQWPSGDVMELKRYGLGALDASVDTSR